MHVCLFEDGVAALEPLSLTRPVFDLRCGMTTLAQKLFRHVSARDEGVLLRPWLADLYRSLHPQLPVNDPAWLGADDLMLINGRWLPPRESFVLPPSSCVGLAQDEVAYVVLRKKAAATLDFELLPALLEDYRHTLPTRQAGGCWIRYPWDLVEQNGREIERDYTCPTLKPSAPIATLAVIGPRERLWIASSARVEPMVVADTTAGPVVIDEGAAIGAFTRLEGPCYIGPGSQIFGARIRAGTTLGPHCRAGGEIEASILHGYNNKYHDGFLGHSYLGEWVNLGAGTHNSDLRNDYGEVSVYQRGQPIATGMTKAGCFIGDHTKTGLGTLLNTGTNVGAFCNLLPAGRFAPKYVPSFTSWWNGALRESASLEQQLATAEIVMQRRGVHLTDAHRDLYTRVLEDTKEDRRRALRESEQRHLRRSA
jgi:UDP-N-acetylglucosamine diphosphorylase/glucosamine-1-phosphate N-acetyltransferase